MVNDAWYQGLAPDVREIVDEAARRAQAEEREWAIVREGTAALQAVEAGLEITVPADGEREWIEKARSVWPMFYDNIGGKAFVDSVVAFLEESRKR